MTGAVQTSPRPHCGRMPLDAMRDPVRPLPGVRVETVELLTSVFPLRPEVVSGSAFGLAKTSVFILTFSCSGAARASSALGGSAGTFGVGGRRDTFPCRVPVCGAPEPCGLRRRRKYVRSEGVPCWLRPRFFTLTEIVVFTASAASHVRCGPFAAVPMRRTGLRRKGAGASRRRRRTAEEPENRRAEKPLAPCLAPPPLPNVGKRGLGRPPQLKAGGAGTFRGTKKTRRSCRGGSGERRTVRKVACGRIRARFAHDFRIGIGASGPRMRNFRHTAGSPAVFRRGGTKKGRAAISSLRRGLRSGSRRT